MFCVIQLIKTNKLEKQGKGTSMEEVKRENKKEIQETKKSLPLLVAERFKARVCGSSLVRFASFNPAGGWMFVS